MSIGAFTDKKHQPTMDEVLATLGSQRSEWEQLIRYISEKFRAQSEFKFYGKKLGWAVRFRKSGKALLSLYPAKGGFTVQIIATEAHVTKALNSAISDKTSRTIEGAHPYPEGRWIFIGIETDSDIEDVKQLLDIKARPTRA